MPPVRNHDWLRIGNARVSLDQREVEVDGQPARLSWRAFQALRCLVKKPGDVVSRTELFRSSGPVCTLRSRASTTASSNCVAFWATMPLKPFHASATACRPSRSMRYPIRKTTSPQTQRSLSPSYSNPHRSARRNPGSGSLLLPEQLRVVAVLAGLPLLEKIPSGYSIQSRVSPAHR